MENSICGVGISRGSGSLKNYKHIVRNNINSIKTDMC